jgi:bacteriocin-like protein
MQSAISIIAQLKIERWPMMTNEKLMALDFVELTDEELQEINGGRQSAVEGGDVILLPAVGDSPWWKFW